VGEPDGCGQGVYVCGALQWQAYESLLLLLLLLLLLQLLRLALGSDQSRSRGEKSRPNLEVGREGAGALGKRQSTIDERPSQTFFRRTTSPNSSSKSFSLLEMSFGIFLGDILRNPKFRAPAG
jgi:hypothetical protein